MKKKLLVAALVAGFASVVSVAQAEDSVVLYGTLDGGLGFNTYTIKQNVENVKTTTAAGRGFNFVNGVNQASKLGFKGNAFIYGDTSVFFKLETGLNVLTGAGGLFAKNGDDVLASLFNRAAYFGFEGSSWGSLTAGRQDSASKSLRVLPFANFAVGTALPSGQLGDITPANNFKGTVYGNAAGDISSNVKYISPRVLGFQLGVSYDFKLLMLGDANTPDDQLMKYHTLSYVSGQSDKPSRSNQHVSAGLNFQMGPVTLAATYDLYRPIGVPYDFDLSGTPVAPNKKANNNEQAYSVGAAFNIRGIVLQGSWAQAFSDIAFKFGAQSNVGKTMASNLYPLFFNDKGTDGGFTTQKWRNNAFSASITIPATEQGKFYFAYNGAITKADRVSFNKDENKNEPATMGDVPTQKVKAFTQLWSAGYVQNVSKYTSLYVYAGFGDVKFSTKDEGKDSWDEQGTARLQQYGIGITHNF